MAPLNRFAKEETPRLLLATSSPKSLIAVAQFSLRNKQQRYYSIAGITFAHDRIKLFAFCIMPDHYHMTLCLMPSEDLAQLMQDSNKFTARGLNKLFQREGTFWQEGFRDRRCRNEDELHDLSLYIEHNPVRAGLVQTAEEWPCSSANPHRRHLLDREWWP